MFAFCSDEPVGSGPSMWDIADPVRRAEITALGELAGELLAAGGAVVSDMHEGIAGRPFGVLGGAGWPAQVIHDGISSAVYAAVRTGLRGAARAGAHAAALRAGHDGESLSATTCGSIALGALNGFLGDQLAARGSELALPMTIRRDPGDEAGPRVAVFVHGLCETDDAWRLRPPGGGTGRPSYGDRLRDELGLTPLYVRYNSGLHISDNGRRLAQLLDELSREWPRPIEEITLVGHSMGGLVARSACHYAALDGLSWSGAVRHVFCLGSPHLGADLEKGANLLGWALGRLPETRPFGKAVNARSVGIKDLRYGSCLEEDWRDRDPDELLRDRCGELPFLPGASYYFVAASVRDGPLGTLLGDLFVRVPSASGRGAGSGRRIAFEVENGSELSGLTHFDLVRHPAVYEQLRAWISRADRTRS
jgi:pimeloyl-ACP methyl ester carboxylesterase